MFLLKKGLSSFNFSVIYDGMIMDEKIRIQKDIVMFEENIQTLKEKSIDEQQKKIVELASQYYEDSKYYLEKKDYFTAFGCINYAHGLLDAVLKCLISINLEKLRR